MSTWWLLIRLWLIVQTVLVAGAWILTPFKLLDARGYTVIFVVAAIWSVSEVRRSRIDSEQVRRDLRKTVRRFKRPLPATIGAIWLISLIGGLAWLSVYADTLSYRLPRMLHWLAEKQWLWIPSDDSRINAIGLNMELVWMPFYTMLKGDRLLFLLNLSAYTLLPGLFFSFLRGMRIAGRTAWNWMWILPGGYVFALQAASLGNDAYAAVVALAAMAFAFRARKTADVREAWLSILAAGFLTGIKQVAVPFGLLWLPAIIPTLGLMRRRIGTSVLVIAVATLVSFLPLTIQNTVNAGTWQGFTKAELRRFEQNTPVWGVIGGSFSVIVHNLTPPVFPFAQRWNALMAEFTSGTQLGSHFRYDYGIAMLQALVAEHSASMGLGVVALLIATRVAKRSSTKSPTVDWTIRAIRIAPFFAVLFFLARSSVSFEPRLVTPYYPFFIPIFLAPIGISQVVRRRWWQRLAIAANLVTIAVLVTSRQRPMLPMLAITERLAARNPQSAVAAKLKSAFVTPHLARNKIFPKIHASIPESEKIVGYAVGHQPFLEIALWYPMGSRRVVRINAADTAESIRAKGIRYVLVDPSAVEARPIDEWLVRYRGKVVAQFEATLVHQYQGWIAYVVRLDD
ncbi:MAG TPA: hypothetical protein VM680_11150 [Verrucomicrobiae bacterium]|nr:hypothetical protein [Verrucomicrobiae bacterium]